MAVNMENQEGIQVHNLEGGREQLSSGPHGHGLSSSVSAVHVAHAQNGPISENTDRNSNLIIPLAIDTSTDLPCL